MYGHGELLLPIYGSERIYENHPPLREYIWDEDNLPEAAVEYPFRQTALFVPGLASIAPCTSENNNLRLGDDRGWAISSDDGGVHRTTHPHAGAFSYRHNVTYIATRDIAAGEELTVYCDDDSFDGGNYYLNLYESSKNDDRVTCLDQNLKIGTASKKTSDGVKNQDNPMGLGVFAKRDLANGETIISTPLIPIHRETLEITSDDEVNDKQLMLNYVFGHPESNLMLLPHGPMVNFINHRKNIDGGANAEIKWHHLNDSGQYSARDEGESKGYHDVSLFDLPGEVVAATHGRGLVIDIVATRDIEEGEEVYLDYGDIWQAAWDKHSARFQGLKGKLSQSDYKYVSASNHNQNQKDSTDIPSPYRTESEEEVEPYPENIEFFCFYHLPDPDRESMYKTSEATSSLGDDDTSVIRYSFFDHSVHNCLRPCSILKRYPYEPRDENEGIDFLHDERKLDSTEPMYTVMVFEEDNERVVDNCGIPTDCILDNIPQSEIRLLDKPFTTDTLSTFAFRHEIGVPKGFYPETWLSPRLRLRARNRAVALDETPSNYKLTKQSSNARSES